MTTHEILKNSSTIEFKEMELYKQTKRTYIYNMNNNISLLSAVDAVKSKYPDDKKVPVNYILQQNETQILWSKDYLQNENYKLLRQFGINQCQS